MWEHKRTHDNRYLDQETTPRHICMRNDRYVSSTSDRRREERMIDTDRRQAIMYLYEKSVVQLNTALQEVSKRTLFSHEIVQ